MKAGVDEWTRGMVIGEFTNRVELIAPNGNVQARAHIANADANAAIWGSVERDRLLASKCGDGLPLSDHPDVAHEIYGQGEWDVRIYT